MSREEKITINIKLDISDNNRDIINKSINILENQSEISLLKSGHEVSIDYIFSIDYLNGINKRFEAILNIMNLEDIKIEIGYKELKYGKILLKNLLDKIDILEGK